MADFSQLPRELIVSIAKRMDTLEEFIIFGAVCKSWRSAATKENFLATSELRSSHQAPLLMLPKDKGAYASPRNLLSLTKGKIFQLDLSVIDGTHCLSSLGWLLTLSRDSNNKFSKFNLIHPLNHSRIELPDGPRMMAPLFLDSMMKFVLSSSPAWTSDYIVMVHGHSTLAFWIPSHGGNWRRLCFKQPGWIDDVTYYDRRPYLVDLTGRVSVCDIEDPNPTNAALRVVAPDFPKQLLGPMMKIKATYLVESAGDLLVVLCFYRHRQCETTIGFRVFKVPFRDGSSSWLDSEVKNLGNRSLFLCKSTSSFSVEASDSCQWKANCIYFMNNKRTIPRAGMDMGIFHMDEGHIERPFGIYIEDGPMKPLSEYCIFDNGAHFETSHLWIEPSF